MKQTSQVRRGRSRTGQGRKNNGQNRGHNRQNQSRHNPGRVKQQATQAMEKYLNLFREARISGDRIEAENYRQHADHYYRVVAEANAQLMEMQDAKMVQVKEDVSVSHDDSVQVEEKKQDEPEPLAEAAPVTEQKVKKAPVRKKKAPEEKAPEVKAEPQADLFEEQK